MNEADVLLARLPQADGQIKNRPCLALRRMPGFGDWLVCGISTQLRHEVQGFDETLRPTDADFASSGLKAPSLIRLGFLAVLPEDNFFGAIGSVDRARHGRLVERLAAHLTRDPG